MHGGRRRAGDQATRMGVVSDTSTTGQAAGPGGPDPRQVLEDLKRRLEQTPRHRRPLEHAALRYSLGMAWAELPTGDRELNLSRAIAAYEDAASLFTVERFPVEHARVQNARGAALRELGDHRRAVTVLEHALEVLRTADDGDHAAEYGAALNNLGLAKSELGEHDQAVRILQDAAGAFATGGRDLTRQRVMAMHNLAQAQAAADDHEAAVATYGEAIADTDPEELPYHWGVLHHGLGVSLTGLERPEQAAEAFQRSLQVFTRQRYPFQHALAKNNLGLAYAQIGGVTSLRRAVAAYEDALQTLDVRLHRPQWQQAYQNLEMAEQALEDLEAGGSRAEHLAALSAELDEDERAEFLRERLMSVMQLPETQRLERLAELDLAALRLPEPGPRRYTSAWLNVLMELPNDMLIAGLRARIAAMGELSEDEQDTAGEMLEIAIREEMLAPQRIRVRDTLEHLGYERRW